MPVPIDGALAGLERQPVARDEVEPGVTCIRLPRDVRVVTQALDEDVRHVARAESISSPATR